MTYKEQGVREKSKKIVKDFRQVASKELWS